MTQPRKMLNGKVLHKKKKSPFQAVKWYNSIRFASLVGFLVFFFVISYAIYYAVKVRAKAQILAESDRLAIQLGGNVVNELLTDVSKVASLAQAQAATISGQDNQNTSLQPLLQTMLTGQETLGVESGGVWTVPSAWQDVALTNSYWRIQPSGDVLFRTDEFKNIAYEDYASSEWFASGIVSEPNQCVWSELYLDLVTSRPKMSCTIRSEREDAISTVDLDLKLLSEHIATWQKRINGYIFITDRMGKIISFPSNKAVQDYLLHGGKQPTSVSELALNAPNYALIGELMDIFDKHALLTAKKKYSDAFDVVSSSLSQFVQYTNLLSVDRHTVAVIDPLADYFSQDATTLFGEVSFDDDYIFNEPARAYLFHVPQTYWKLVMVMPTRQADAVANELSNDLLKYILLAFAVASLVGYIFINRSIIAPLERTASTLQIIGDLINQKRYLELNNHSVNVTRKDEVGLVRYAINSLIERVARNEGEIAATNILLEKKVNERTHELTAAMNHLKRSQTDLVSAEKMALLGQMVAGVAHEVNTPLGYVKNNVLMTKDIVGQYNELIHQGARLGELLSLPQFSEREIQKTMDEIVELATDLSDENVADDMNQLFDDTLFGVEQISELVVNLKNFARIDKSKVKNIDIHECIESSLNIARSNLKKFEVKKRYQKVPKVFCSPSQINQVFLNLFNNAAQALASNNGIITIETIHDDEFVFVKVIDNGVGMPESISSKIFQPFFTTKGAGEGTGLGLAISHQIIEQHKGNIWVSSKEGEGTCFTVCLPIEKDEY